MKHLLQGRGVRLAPPLLALAALSLALASAASSGSASASASASAPAPASASGSASASASAPAPSIGDWAPPGEASNKPKPEEWEKAPSLALLRPHRDCTAAAIREWLRISCRSKSLDEYKGLRVIGGSEKDVEIADFTLKKDKDTTIHGLHVIFPVRQGDRRLLTLVGWIDGGWKSFYLREDTAVTISSLWLPGERGPTVVVH